MCVTQKPPSSDKSLLLQSCTFLTLTNVAALIIHSTHYIISYGFTKTPPLTSWITWFCWIGWHEERKTSELREGRRHAGWTFRIGHRGEGWKDFWGRGGFADEALGKNEQKRAETFEYVLYVCTSGYCLFDLKPLLVVSGPMVHFGLFTGSRIAENFVDIILIFMNSLGI